MPLDPKDPCYDQAAPLFNIIIILVMQRLMKVMKNSRMMSYKKLGYATISRLGNGSGHQLGLLGSERVHLRQYSMNG